MIIPYYDYKCTTCGYTKELITLGDPDLFRFCDGCGNGRYFERQVSAPKSFVLKGQGFYKPSATDPKENTANK